MPPRRHVRKRSTRRSRPAASRSAKRRFGNRKTVSRRKPLAKRRHGSTRKRSYSTYGASNKNHGQSMSASIGRFRRRRDPKSFRMKIMDAITPTDVYQYNSAGGYTAGGSSCGYFIPGRPLMDTNDLRAIAQRVPSAGNDRASISYASFIFKGGLGVQDLPKKFLIRRARQTSQIENVTTSTINCRAYLCSARSRVPAYDENDVTESGWQVGFLYNKRATNTTYPGSGFALVPPTEGRSYLYDGFADAAPGDILSGGSLASSSLRLEPTATLFNNPRFCSVFKIEDVHTFKMTAGEIKNFNVTHNSPKWVNCEKIDDDNFQIGDKPYKFWVIQHWGEPTLDSTTSGPLVNWGPSEIIHICTSRYEYKWLTNNITTQVTFDTLGTAVNPQSFMNEVTSLAETALVM